MRTENKIIIKKPVQEVWSVLGDNFEKAGEWMAIVNNSYSLPGEPEFEEASVQGRTCEFGSGPEGFKAKEFITQYDPKNYRLGIKVIPINAPKALPLKENEVDIRLLPKGSDETEVIWVTNPIMNLAGKMLSPLLKVGIQKSFGEILEELKVYVETGKPHKRKIRKMEKAIA